ncbi:unnamed protein product [Toxocara canis]|uniref:ABC transporter domain-containing protein n=1 Tax=Toxocara canis TaxID=6265 RepID=A0A183U878_TOXCA|nr:unnamed protein product [Toxocara canis]
MSGIVLYPFSRNAQGITLSNGQKLRINIARAAYQSADIFLLDDPFSSVDRRIANRIFVNLFGGVLHNKTTIFTTDALHLLKNVDRIIVVEEGGIHEQGTYEQLLRNRGLFSELVREFVIKEMQGRAERERRYSYSDYS